MLRVAWICLAVAGILVVTAVPAQAREVSNYGPGKPGNTIWGTPACSLIPGCVPVGTNCEGDCLVQAGAPYPDTTAYDQVYIRPFIVYPAPYAVQQTVTVDEILEKYTSTRGWQLAYHVYQSGPVGANGRSFGGQFDYANSTPTFSRVARGNFSYTAYVGISWCNAAYGACSSGSAGLLDHQHVYFNLPRDVQCTPFSQSPFVLSPPRCKGDIRYKDAPCPYGCLGSTYSSAPLDAYPDRNVAYVVLP